jgi:uracil-DNA glycosylase
MRVSESLVCRDFPCTDVDHGLFSVPDVHVSPQRVAVVVVSEAAALRREDGYYASDASVFAQTTLEAFRDAGTSAASIADLLRRGVYLTTAVKCAKTAYALQSATIKTCSELLAQELALLPHVRALLLMGDVAIKAINSIARRAGEPRVIPAGATYKLRGGEYVWRGARVFPSYLQAGPSFYIENAKRRMIAEDIAAALALVQ